jgi:fucose permease
MVVLLLEAFFALARLKHKQKSSEPYLERLKILTRERIVIVLFIATALIVGGEGGTIGILTTFLMELREFTQVTSKIGLTVFLVGVAGGRLFVGFFTRREQIVPYLLVLFALSTLFLFILYFVDLGPLTYLPIFLAGAAISALLPLVFTLAGLLYQEIAGTVLGTVKIAIPIGGIIIPFAMSLIAEYSSLQLSLLLFPLVPLLGFLLILSVAQQIKSIEMTASVEATQ